MESKQEILNDPTTPISGAPPKAVSLGLFDTISMIIKVIPLIRALTPLPDWTIGQQVREWLKQVTRMLAEFAKTTETPCDDAAVALFTAMLESDSMWDLLWSMVQNQISAQGLSKGESSKNEEGNLEMLAETSGIAIGTLAALVSAIVAVIGLFKKQ